MRGMVSCSSWSLLWWSWCLVRDTWFLWTSCFLLLLLFASWFDLIWLILSNCFLLILLKIQLLLESSLFTSVCLSTENLQKVPVLWPYHLPVNLLCRHLPLNECCSLLCQSTTASSSFWGRECIVFSLWKMNLHQNPQHLQTLFCAHVSLSKQHSFDANFVKPCYYNHRFLVLKRRLLTKNRHWTWCNYA